MCIIIYFIQVYYVHACKYIQQLTLYAKQNCAIKIAIKSFDIKNVAIKKFVVKAVAIRFFRKDCSQKCFENIFGRSPPEYQITQNCSTYSFLVIKYTKHPKFTPFSLKSIEWILGPFQTIKNNFHPNRSARSFSR